MITFISPLLLSLISYIGQTKAEEIDFTLLQSILPPISEACDSHFSSAQANSDQQTSSTFTYSDGSSDWDSSSAPYEPQLFLAEMSHDNIGNSNHSWTMRLGSAGNVYSFRGAYGEAMPPQGLSNAPWVDEVFQTVSVNQAKNQNSGKKYFIHQAGTYTKDSPYTDNNPFHSPNIAKHCSGRTCMFGAWGQQAHIPTFHESAALYFNSYTDCGDGVVEFTSAIHNAETDLENGDDFTYFNVPWTGIRKSVLRDILVSDKDSQDLTQVYPLKGWPDMTSGDEEVDNTGGYITFAEELQVSDEVNAATPYVMPSENGESLRLIVNKNNPFRQSQIHSDRYGEHCGYLRINPTFHVATGCRDCNLWFENSRTGEGVHVVVTIHWNWISSVYSHIYFCPRGVTDADMNAIFRQGDEVLIKYNNSGKPAEENFALTHVYGRQNDLVDNWAPYRVRFGGTVSTERDANIYTINTRLEVDPGDTYVYRQYLITGEYNGMEAQGKAWVEEAYEVHIPLGELEGDDIHLFSADETSFTVAVGSGTCPQGVNRCTGKSAPGYNLIAHFAITCGSNSYVGSDRYAFSPARASDTDNVRSYVCDGETNDTRPTWQLLGYFQDGSCDFLLNASYDSTTYTCQPSSSPTIVPSSNPTLVPSPVPSSSPTLVPSPVPSSAPTCFPFHLLPSGSSSECDGILYDPITSREECVEAGLAVGGILRDGRLKIGSSTLWPKGCFLSTHNDDAVVYSTSDGFANPMYSNVCRKKDPCVPITLAPTPAPDEYILLPRGSSSECEGSYRPVPEEDCAEAGLAVGGILRRGRMKTGTSSSWPLGCFLSTHSDSAIVFSTGSNPSANIKYSSVCIVGGSDVDEQVMRINPGDEEKEIEVFFVALFNKVLIRFLDVLN